MADVAELSPSGEVAYQSGKGPGENYKPSPRLSPLADNGPDQGLPNWNPAEVLKGAVQWGNPIRRACPAVLTQQNSQALGGA